MIGGIRQKISCAVSESRGREQVQFEYGNGAVFSEAAPFFLRAVGFCRTVSLIRRFMMFREEAHHTDSTERGR